MNFLALLLPALIPSWRFFDGIAPSPRIEIACLEGMDAEPHWTEFRPRPDRVPITQMIKRLFWNTNWNEYLFLVSCSERLRDGPTQHSLNVIKDCIRRDLPAARVLQFRVVFVSIEGEALSKEILYTSEIEPAALP